ncbi:class II fructose-bisphosphatase [Pseudobacteriovorax antillogorgiicola]|uniref:Fructose-1,6-bisphosphatase n=1 Tax=Pseudobacteriovorax antillogorgiicola TaxID=1513793 RepID=A0A1Y6C1G3_9BACT|nr:class II fructose-bisphosphatase [Pseudobacteriovorax antillogorgiicola]TCS50704.1 fructose-1,6-bisphosphatase II [Pseudobacteriovorax antillogorgiicola]SMF40543.1 fructose-1,6-bisphosphatase II [Pseudobacteriovorax antillogorgiicola]
MDRNLALEFVRVTEAAALSCGRWIGRGDEKAADHAAVESMRKAFDSISFDGTIKIGEGERDEAPMLYIGEKVGSGQGPKIDIACDPLEGTSITAQGRSEALAVIAAAEEGNFLHAPDTYMQKLACGPQGRGVIDIRESPTWNVKKLAEATGRDVEDLMVIILDRPRHEDLIAEVREAGARIRLIGDGDVSAAIATAQGETGVDLLMGVGGAPEGVIAAAALRCLGGEMQGILKFRKEDEKERARKMGITDFDQIYSHEELASGNVMFVATGVTNGSYLKGVRYNSYGATTHSIVMRSESGTIREITSRHHFSKKPNYGW